MSDFISPLSGDRLTPAEALLFNDSFTSKQTGPKNMDCYICRDPDFSQMGLPLCTACAACGGHVAADDTICDMCGEDQMDLYYRCKCVTGCKEQAAGEGAPEPTLCHQCNGNNCDVRP